MTGWEQDDACDRTCSPTPEPALPLKGSADLRNVKQYFVIGGDGTQAGAFETFSCTQEIGHEVAVAPRRHSLHVAQHGFHVLCHAEVVK